MVFELPARAVHPMKGPLSVTPVPDGQAEFWKIRDAGCWIQ